MRIYISIILFGASLLSIGCQPIATSPGDAPQPPPTQTSIPSSPTEGEMQMTPMQGTPLAPGLQSLIEKAKSDLAQRLSASASDILVLEATSVTWPDSSLGCPQEGMLYAQVLTPGYLIRLASGGQEFEYHASRGTEVIYCEDPMPPVEGTPGDI